MTDNLQRFVWFHFVGRWPPVEKGKPTSKAMESIAQGFLDRIGVKNIGEAVDILIPNKATEKK